MNSEDVMDLVDLMSLEDLMEMEMEPLNGIQISELQYNGDLAEYYGER